MLDMGKRSHSYKNMYFSMFQEAKEWADNITEGLLKRGYSITHYRIIQMEGGTFLTAVGGETETEDHVPDPNYDPSTKGGDSYE
jgi:hypothetical protein